MLSVFSLVFLNRSLLEQAQKPIDIRQGVRKILKIAQQHQVIQSTKFKQSKRS